MERVERVGGGGSGASREGGSEGDFEWRPSLKHRLELSHNNSPGGLTHNGGCNGKKFSLQVASHVCAPSSTEEDTKLHNLSAMSTHSVGRQ